MRNLAQRFVSAKCLDFVHTATRFRKSRHARLAQSTRAETAHARFVADLPAVVFATRRGHEQLQDECLGYFGAGCGAAEPSPRFAGEGEERAAQGTRISGARTGGRETSRRAQARSAAV